MVYHRSSIYNGSELNKTSWKEISELKQVPVFYVILLIVLIIVGSVGNTIVISSFTKRKFRTPVHMLVVNLAAIDLVICIVQIPLTLVNLFCGFVDNASCILTGILGTLLFNYSVQVQFLILYSHVRIVTAPLQFKSQAVTWRRFGICTIIFLLIDTFVALFPKLMYGYSRHLSAVGYCFFGYDSTYIVSGLIGFLYTFQFIVIVFLFCFFYRRLIVFITRNSSREDLVNQRHIVLFRLMMRKFMIWALCYSLLVVTRFGRSSMAWPDQIYQASYFLVWTNSVLNPVIQIFSKSTRRTYRFCFPTRVAPNGTFITVLPVTSTSQHLADGETHM